MDGVPKLVASLKEQFAFLDDRWALRLIRAYGTEAQEVLGGATTAKDLGVDFGASLTEREVIWQMTREYARRAEDVVWRRTKLGLRMTAEQISALDVWMQDHARGLQKSAAE